MRRTLLGAAAAAAVLLCAPALACEDGLSISEISSGGSIVVLDDGSVWEIVGGDASSWSDGDDVTLCGNKIVNHDERETLEARRLR